MICKVQTSWWADLTIENNCDRVDGDDYDDNDDGDIFVRLKESQVIWLENINDKTCIATYCGTAGVKYFLIRRCEKVGWRFSIDTQRKLVICE